MNKKRFLSIFLMVFLVAALAACGSGGSSSGNGGNAGSSGEENTSGGESSDKGTNEEGTSEESTSEGSGEATNEGGSVDKSKTYIVATDNSFVPFEFVNQDTGKIQGFDIDLIKAAAEQAGIKIKIKTMNFSGIIPGLKSGRWAMGIAGMSITEKRDKSIDFSIPYYQSGLIVAVQADNTDIHGVDDLAGKTVSTRQGSTSQQYLKNKLPKAKAKAFPKITQGYQALAAGRVDATLYDAPNIKYYIKTNAKGEIKTVGEKITAENYGIGFQEDSPLVPVINKALKEMMNNGTYKEIYKKWFGEAPPTDFPLDTSK
ncbi:MAG TPA: transporter substrate-binding domain-containing protein [Bacillales bacterium]